MPLVKAGPILVTTAVLAACAHTPDVSLTYYLPRSEANFKVLRTVACDAADNPIVATSVSPSVKHAADPASPRELAIGKLNSALSDTDVKLDFYEDGRLKAVNATNTGQGETILKTAITLATAAIALDGKPHPYPVECAFIKQAGGGKPLTVTYEGAVDLAAANYQPISPDTTSSYYADQLENAIGNVCAVVEKREAPPAPASYDYRSEEIPLKLRHPGLVSMRVTAGGMKSCKRDVLWRGALPIAQYGREYSLPIPRAAAFGKQTFAVTIAESGALNSVQYATNTGSGQLINVLNSTLTATQGESTAQKVADTKAEADLIAQQQRLVQCIADRASCK